MKIKFLLFFLVFAYLPVGLTAQIEINAKFTYEKDFLNKATYHYAPQTNLLDSVVALPKIADFVDYPKKTFSEGLANGTHWFKVFVKNTTSKNKRLVISFSNNELDIVKAYKKVGEEEIFLGKDGDLLPFYSRPTSNFSLAIPFEVYPNEVSDIYIGIQKNNRYVSSKISFLEFDFWQQSSLSTQLLLGIWFGGLTFYLLTSLLLSLALKQRMYWFYFFYVLFTLLFMLAKESVLWKYVYPNFPEANDVLASRFSQIALGFFGLFSARFLTVGTKLVKFQKWMEVLAYSMFFFALISSLNNFISMDWTTPLLIPLFFVTLLLYVLSFFAIGLFIAFNKKTLNAIAFTVAFFLMLITVLATALGFFNANLQIIGVQNGLYSALLLEITILSFYLVYRLNRIQDEKIFFQQALGNERQKNINYLIEGQERERGRIGREIHDALGSKFSILLQAIRASQPALTLEKEVSSISNTIREISYEMMPRVLSESGLELAIRSSMQKLQQRDNRDFIFYAHDWPNPLNNFVTINLYRLYQEALTNALKHANFQEFSVQLISDEDELLMQIDDDGKGFSVSKEYEGLGLRNMQTRAEAIGASISIESSENSGTTIMIKLPNKKAASENRNGLFD